MQRLTPTINYNMSKPKVLFIAINTDRKVVGASASWHCDLDQTHFGPGTYNLQSLSALSRNRVWFTRLDGTMQNFKTATISTIKICGWDRKKYFWGRSKISKFLTSYTIVI